MNKGLFEKLNHRGSHYAILVVVSLLLFMVNLGGPSLWDWDEGRNATASQEMMEAANWVVPTFNGELRVHKPALLNWFQILSFKIFGVNEFAVRFPSALGALLAVIVCYELGRRMFSAHTGLIAGLAIASAPMFCAAARFANQDAVLNMLTASTFLVFWLGYERALRESTPRISRWAFAGMGAVAGVAVLAKGPVGLVLPGTIIGLFLIWNRQWRLLLDSRLMVGATVFLAVALPWYILVAHQTRGAFLSGFLLTHNVNRFLTTMESHNGSVLYYLFVLLIGFGAWSIFLAFVAWSSFWSTVKSSWPLAENAWTGAEVVEGDEQKSRLQMSAYRLLCTWIAVYLVFFTIAATKLPNYVLPVSVPLAVLTGRFLERWRRGTLELPRWGMPLSLGCLFATGIFITLALSIVGGVIDVPSMRERSVQELSEWALLGLVPIIGAGIAWWCFLQRNRDGLVSSVAVTAILLVVLLAGWGALIFNRYKAPRPLVEHAGALQRDREIRIGGWQIEHLPSLNFYCQRQVHHYNSEAQAVQFLESPMPVYLFLPAESWEAVAHKVKGPNQVLSRHRDMYKNCDIVVVTNQMTH